jgi:hypothetical protein
MRVAFIRCVLLGACFLGCAADLAANGSEQVLAKAVQIFGKALSGGYRVYPLNDNYVVWLIFDTHDELIEADVGPKSFYSSVLPNAPLPTNADRLSEHGYEDALKKISQLKDIGALRSPHESGISTEFGALSTDQFEAAFVDRNASTDALDEIKKFNVYFLQNMQGSPEQLKTVQGQPMVCLVGLWYYIPPTSEANIKLGEWQVLHAAGPNLRGTHGCFRTTILHDADGFTIEEPQNATIIVTEPYKVRSLAGRVTISGQPVEGANVEVLAVGGRKILRSKTDRDGDFRIPDAPDGEYKFKVTKDGFNALSGKIIVNRKAPSAPLSFGLNLGT